MALKAKRIYLSIYLSILRLSVCQSVSQYKCCFQTSHPLSYKFLGLIYLSFCLNEFFYRLPNIHNPSSPLPRLQKIKKILEFIHLSVRLSVCLSACQFVCFSVCIRKQVLLHGNSTITMMKRIVHRQSHDSKKAFKVNQSVFWLFSSAK